MKINNKLIYLILFKLIIFYQNIISPVIPARCRYYPTCSEYGKQALTWHGVWGGSWLLIKRIGRCHPLGGHGIDFVPLPLASYNYFPINDIDTTIVQTLSTSIAPTIYRDKSSYTVRLNHLMSRC